jgi:hypothetical protein
VSRWFLPVKDYSQNLSSAHRKPATPVGAPSLIAHFAFWQPASSDDAINDPSSVVQTKEEWKRRADAYIHSIYCIIKDMNFTTPNSALGGRPGLPDFIFLFFQGIETASKKFELLLQEEIAKKVSYKIDRYFKTRNPAVVFNFIWHHLQITLKFERHSEYLTVTTFIDLSINTEESFYPGDRLSLPEDEKNICKQICSSLLELNNNIKRYRSTIQSQDEKIDGSYWKEQFETQYSKLYSWIWEIFLEEVLLSKDAMLKFGFDSSETAAGIQSRLGGLFANFRGLVIGSGHPETDAVPLSPTLQKPRWRPLGATQKSWLGRQFAEDEASLRVRELWPFITCNRDIPFARTEVSVSLMLNKRAIYITALGAQPSLYLEEDHEQKADTVPVYYLAYVSTFSGWQISRLIDTINHLGTVRLAAIQELGQLNLVSNELRPVLLPDNADDTKIIRGKIVGWDKLFCGGLNFRIERSRYYVQQFTNGVDFLEISNVEGYQSYEKFVLRRLGSTFDFINRLGIRVERTKSDLNTLLNSFNVHEATRHTKKFLEIQIYAELFVYFFIGPYYVNSGLDHIFTRFCPKPNGLENTVIGMLYVGIWLVFLRLGIYKAYQSIQERTELYGGTMPPGKLYRFVKFFSKIPFPWFLGKEGP